MRGYVYGIFNQDESRVLGGSGLHTRLSDNALEIGYWLHKDFINQSYVTESSAALTKVAFELYHVDRMEIHCSVENLASASVPRKLGYTHEATRRRLGWAHGQHSDSMVWTLFANEYLLQIRPKEHAKRKSVRYRRGRPKRRRNPIAKPKPAKPKA